MNLLPGWSNGKPAKRSEAPATPNQDVLVEAYEKYATAIFRFAYRRLGNRDDAQDVTAQVFLKASRGLDASYDEDSRRSWLFRAARTAIVDVWRSYGDVPVVPLEWYAEDTPTVERGSGDASERVERVLARLNPIQRRVLELRFLEGRSLL